jgi:hypothetical protein
VPDRPIFRESALEAYRRRTDKDVVPRLVSRPIILCSWALLATLIGAAVLAWSVRVPSYAAASGVVVGQRSAVLFLAPDESAQVRVGRSVQMQLGSSGMQLRGTLVKLERGVIGPETARARYRLDTGSGPITEPARAVVVRLRETLPSASYGGSGLTARVQTGSQRLLGLFPALGTVVNRDS